MKKLTFTSLCCFALAFMSCQKKEYTCHCDGGFSGNGDTFIIKNQVKEMQKVNAIITIPALTPMMGFIIAN